MKNYIVTRSQRSRGDHPGHFGGPDRYISVVRVPDDVSFDPCCTPLNVNGLAKKGIQCIRIGEYYSRHTGPRSMYYRVMELANQYLLDTFKEEVENLTEWSKSEGLW